MIEHRLNTMWKTPDSSAHEVYKPKSSKFHRHSSKITPELRALLIDKLKEVIIFFGYIKAGDNPYGFYELTDATGDTYEAINTEHMKLSLGAGEKAGELFPYSADKFREVFDELYGSDKSYTYYEPISK